MSHSNLANRTIFCHDNLEVLQGINSDSIDLIYLDPPFNKKKEFTAPMGSSAEGASFRDWFREEDVKDEWLQTIKEDYDGIYQFLTNVRNLSSFQSSPNKHYLYNYCYLCYMAVRLIEMQRILKETGSIYLHCDPTMSHYLKILMDLIFGEKNFRNEIVWNRHSSGQKGNQFKPKKWGANTDHIFFYVKSNHVNLNPLVPFTAEEIRKKFKHKDEKGEQYQIVPIIRGKNKGDRPNLNYTFRGINPPPSPNGWSLSKERMDEEYTKGNIVIKNNRLERRKYLKDSLGKSMGNNWDDIKPSYGKEYVGYPTQKPLKLLERIIQASSNEGDVILDPFCGCATTCVAAEKLGRQWIGVDISHMAYELVRQRLKNEVKKDLFDPDKETKYTTVPPKRTDTNGDDRLKKYVYIISNEQFGKNVYKVGIAKDYKSRFNSYQTADPYRVYKLEFYFLTPYFRETEKYIHKKFDNLGEWVQGDLEAIKKEIKNYTP